VKSNKIFYAAGKENAFPDRNTRIENWRSNLWPEHLLMNVVNVKEKDDTLIG